MSQLTQSDEAAWISGFVRGGGPRYLQIADALERAVAQGRLRPGDRLPAQRQLADQLNVDLTTITRAYTEARRRNLLDARGAHGTFVAAPRLELTQMLDLSMNIPPPPAGVSLRELLDRALTEVLVRADVDLLMSYHLGGGSDLDRAAGLKWLQPMLGRIDPQRVVVCPGAQAALAALILACTRPGEAIATEPLAYPGIRAAAEQMGRRIVTVAADEEGMLPEALRRSCQEHGARLVYLNPTLQNPTTRTLGGPRRIGLAQTAAACHATIIEDDPYWLLAERPPPPLASTAAGQVCYVATLSKCLAPGLRTAYVVLPDTGVRDRFLTSLRSFALMSTPLMTAVVTQWIHDGTAAQLLGGVRAEARARLDLAQTVLPASTRIPTGGIHLWHPLPPHWTPHTLARSARAEGLAVTASDTFCMAADPPNAIRISLGGVKERPQLTLALRRLAALLMREPPREQAMVV